MKFLVLWITDVMIFTHEKEREREREKERERERERERAQDQRLLMLERVINSFVSYITYDVRHIYLYRLKKMTRCLIFMLNGLFLLEYLNGLKI